MINMSSVFVHIMLFLNDFNTYSKPDDLKKN